MMRILLIKSFWHPSSVGELAKGLKKLGHDVHLLLPQNTPASDDVRNNAIPVHTIDIGADFRQESRLGQTLRVAAEFRRLIRQHAFDVIHLNLAQARLRGRLASLSLPKVKVTSTIRG